MTWRWRNPNLAHLLALHSKQTYEPEVASDITTTYITTFRSKQLISAFVMYIYVPTQLYKSKFRIMYLVLLRHISLLAVIRISTIKRPKAATKTHTTCRLEALMLLRNIF